MFFIIANNMDFDGNIDKLEKLLVEVEYIYKYINQQVTSKRITEALYVEK